MSFFSPRPRALPFSPLARAVLFFRDARCDPFLPASRLEALWFVVSEWRWLSSLEGPYGPDEVQMAAMALNRARRDAVAQAKSAQPTKKGEAA